MKIVVKVAKLAVPPLPFFTGEVWGEGTFEPRTCLHPAFGHLLPQAGEGLNA